MDWSIPRLSGFYEPIPYAPEEGPLPLFFSLPPGKTITEFGGAPLIRGNTPLIEVPPVYLKGPIEKANLKTGDVASKIEKQALRFLLRVARNPFCLSLSCAFRKAEQEHAGRRTPILVKTAGNIGFMLRLAMRPITKERRNELRERPHLIDYYRLDAAKI